MIDTAGTLINAAKAALKHGAKSVSAVATHPVLSEPSLERIQSSKIKHILLTDSIFITESKKLPNMDIVSVANMFGEAIKRIHKGESVSALFGF